MKSRKISPRGGAVLLACLLTACGGGGSSSSTAPITPTVPSSAPKAAAQAHVVITVPAAGKTAAARRRPAFVSPSTQSITVSVDGGTPSVQNLTAGSPGCTAAANPPLNCTVAITATPGTHTVAFVTFDQLNGVGNQLSSNSLSVTFVADTNPAIPVVLNGIAASLVAAPLASNGVTVTAQGGVQFLAESTQRLLVSALDADNNFIVGPGSPVITAAVTNPSAGSGITIAPAPNTANAFALTSTGFGSATLTLTAATPGGTPLSTTLKVNGGAQSSTLAGALDAFAFADGTGAAAQFDRPEFLAYDAKDGNLYVTDNDNCDIRQVNPTTGAVVTIAGNNVAPFTSCGFADGTGPNAQFSFPAGIAYDANDGNLYVTDTNNCDIRQVNPATGAVVTIAGSITQTCGFADGPGPSAQFSEPQGLAYDTNDGNLYVTDRDNCNIRRVNPIIKTVLTIAGRNSNCGFADGTGLNAQFNTPVGIAYDANDHNVYVTDTSNCAIRQINPASGAVVTVAGTFSNCGFADGTGPNAQFNNPEGIAYDANDGNLYVTDNCAVRQVNPSTGAVVTVAGNPNTCGFVDGFGSSAFFNFPVGIAFDSVNGNLAITDNNNNLIRELVR